MLPNPEGKFPGQEDKNETSPARMLTGLASLFCPHQAGRFLWAFTHCSV
jgi:hypothetical protein